MAPEKLHSTIYRKAEKVFLYAKVISIKPHTLEFK